MTYFLTLIDAKELVGIGVNQNELVMLQVSIQLFFYDKIIGYPGLPTEALKTFHTYPLVCGSWG